MKTHFQIILTDSDDDFEELGQETARKHASKIARLLGGTVMDNPQRIAINEPLRPFIITLSIERFKASLCVSNSDYRFEMMHRKGTKALTEDSLFCVSFKNQDRIMFTKDRVVAASKALSIPVYRQGFVEDETVTKWLLCAPVKRCLSKIDFGPVTRLFVSPIQLIATSALDNSAVCVSQIELFRELMDALACARKPDKSSRSAKRSASKRG